MRRPAVASNVGQRGIRTFLTSANATGTPQTEAPKPIVEQLDSAADVKGLSTVPEDEADSIDEQVGAPCALEVSEASDFSNATERPAKRPRNADTVVSDSDSDQLDSDRDAPRPRDTAKAPLPPARTSAQHHVPLVAQTQQPRQQTQRVHKGQSDGSWRENEGPHRFQAEWTALYSWAECIAADVEAGGVHDRVRCGPCSISRRQNVTLDARQATLKNHERSAKHQDAMRDYEERALQHERNQLAAPTVDVLLSRALSKSERGVLQQLRQLFYMLDRGRPILDFVGSKDLFQVLGVPDYRDKHWSCNSAWQFAEALDAVLMGAMRKLVADSRFVSVSLDESTGIDKRSRLCVHVYVMQGWSRIPLCIDLAKLEAAPTADNITSLLVDVLADGAGLTTNAIAQKLVAVSTDGASVMTGVHNGVSTQMTDLAPHIVTIHCMAHRTQLAVGALEQAAVISTLKALVRAIWGHFSNSPKRLLAFEAAAEEADTAGNHPLKDIEIRWLSLLPPLQRIASEYGALLLYMEEAEEQLISAQLKDVRLYLAMHALLPALRRTNFFIKLCQSRHLFIGHLNIELERLKRDLRRMYLQEATRYQSADFEDYTQLLPTGPERDSLDGTNWKLSPEDESVGLLFGDRFIAFHAIQHRRGRGGCIVSLTAELITSIVAAVQAELTAAVQVLVDELEARFPPTALLNAFQILYSEYWETKPTLADFRAKLKVIKDHYGKECELADGSKVPPKLDIAALDAKATVFEHLMRTLATKLQLARVRGETAKLREQQQTVEQAASSSKVVQRKLRDQKEESPTIRLWKQLENAPVHAESLKEYVALAKLVFVMVPGSVEDERRFSAMNFVQSKVRNRLDEHLALCVRMFTQEIYDLHTFPFDAAVKKWREAVTKGRYRMND